MAGKEGSTSRRGKKASTSRCSRQGAGDHEHTPAANPEGCPINRKSSGECEALCNFPEQEVPMEHWAYTLYNPAVRTANPVTAADVSSDDDAELRKRVKSVLLSFPECHAWGSPEEFEQAVDRIVRESKSETASATAPGMERLEDDIISVMLIMKKKRAAAELPGVEAGVVFPQGWLEDRKRWLDEECRPKKKTVGHDLVLPNKVRVDLLTKGYVEFHEGYMDEDPEFDPYVHEGRVRMEYDPRSLRPRTMTGRL